MAFFRALTHQSLELYRKVFPIPCLLCGLPSHASALCKACMAELPRLGPACQRCAMPLQSAQICGRCLRSPPVQDKAFSLYCYQGSVRRCITGFKYHQQLHNGDMFAANMAAVLSERNTLPDCLVPIPLHPLRLRQRGFNQAVELARMLSAELGVPCRTDLLQRQKYTRSQSQLPFRQRRRNIRGAFRCEAVSVPEHIALIDDVMTSGHTSAEAARTLRRRGAQIIEVWTIARTISHY